MPIPFIIGGAALAAGVFGAKKGIDAKKNYSAAKDMVRSATEDFESAKEHLEAQKNDLSNYLEELGRLRLQVESDSMSRFVDLCKKINNVAYKNITLDSRKVEAAPPDLNEIQVGAYRAADLLKDGATAISSGVLTGIGAGGLATSIGVASTGTAISSLSGAAATNATLAWLGGGSLASGGFGMAGGTMVLGGAIAGPMIAALGYAAAKKSERALTEATMHEAEIREAIEQIESGIVVLGSIEQRVLEVGSVTHELNIRLQKAIDSIEEIINFHYQNIGIFKRIWMKITRKKQHFIDFNLFSDTEKNTYSIFTLLGYGLYGLLKVKIIDDSGLVSEESEKLVQDAYQIIEATA